MKNLIIYFSLLHLVSSDLSPVIVKDGKFYDLDDNEVNFRGVNVVYKDSPWLPSTPTFDSNLSFVRDDIDLLKSLGNNLVRLGVMWSGVFPREGRVDESYLTKVDDMIKLLEDNDMYVIVEPHQDELNPLFCGEGAPDWWVNKYTEGVENFPVPVQATPFEESLSGEPPSRATCDTHSSFSYIWTNDGAKAYQRLWEDGAQNGFGSYWSLVAQRYAAWPNVIGGEIFNEPFLGDVFGDPSLRDNKKADLVNLQPFYENITEIVRSATPQQSFALAFEPTWPVGNQDIDPDAILTATSGFSTLPEPNSSIYAFHYYSAPCTTDLDSYLVERLRDAKRLSAVPFASEFNLAAQSEVESALMVDVFNSFENKQISYAGWQYKSYSGSLPNGTCTGCGNNFFNEDGSSNMFFQRSMARVFASVVGGETLRVNSTGLTRYEIEYIPTIGRNTTLLVPSLWAGGVGQDNFMITIDGSRGGYNSRTTALCTEGRVVQDGVEIHSSCEVFVEVYDGDDDDKVEGASVVLTIEPIWRSNE